MPPPPPPQANAGKVTPNLAMDAEATRMLNLTVLQRLDPAVEDILITAAHVTLYDFNIDLNQWVSKRFSLLWTVPGLDHDPIRSDAGFVLLALGRAAKTWKGRCSSSRGGSQGSVNGGVFWVSIGFLVRPRSNRFWNVLDHM